ncbi:GMC oxidoreductase [Pedobacter jejuensis]|uniref:GMC family oxidoreductase n=1 Tax=Pedobacter jejuensis TaxID=1268550 RepID=A0A3N0BUM8_9SPHI|nr:GMC oxidoreductase [Pedobacter jejuensis]RNL52580.1 GMC family oxidoreductase [Pedobacter jejuensis]
MKNDNYDLIVVGTGFASSFFLQKYLAKNKGNKKVLVLERGYFYSHAEKLKARRGESLPDIKYEQKWDSLVENFNPKKDWHFTTGYGGSSNCWWGCTPRFMPSDFKMNSLFGVAQDWPISYDDIEPYYDEAEEIMQISGPDDTPFPKKGKYPLPAHRFSKVDEILNKKYGNQYISQPTARASRATASRNACMASSTCGTCPVDAKFSIENSGMMVYQNPQVEIIYGAQVYKLEMVNDVARKVCYMKDEKEYTAEGEVIALGANPFFNTNILLNSGDKNKFTGKGFGEQLGIQVLIYLDNLSNAGGSTWVNANGYMLYDGQHRKDYAACLIEVNNAPFIRFEENKWLNIASFRLVFEDLPDDKNYITTSANKLKPEVHYDGRSDYAEKAFKNAKIELPKILSCLPVERLKYLDPFPNEGHIIGGTRMSANAETGVVDKYLVHHKYRNVFVLGAGAFTTYSAANPSLTLSALSLFAADKMF